MFHLVRNGSGLLFSSVDLSQITDSVLTALKDEIDRMNANRLLNTAPADLVQYLATKYAIELPRLRRDKWTATESETQVDVRYDSHRWIEDTSHPVLIPGQRIEIEVPVEGDPELMLARASTFTSAPPRGAMRGHSLVLVFEIAHDSGERNIREEAERILSEIEKHLGWIQRDISKFNAGLVAAAETVIKSRRERILANQGRAAALGIPLKKR